MEVDTDSFALLQNSYQKSNAKFYLSIDTKRYLLENVSIVNSPTPVNSPTTRGGVYFSDKFAYKLRGSVNDLSIVPLLTKTMLGPNTDFREIKITTQITFQDKVKDFTIFANLTNSVQGPSKIDLNMIIVKLQNN